MNLLMKGAALAPPFSCTTKYSSDVYSPRPPDIRVRLLPTKPPVHFTTEQPGRDTALSLLTPEERALIQALFFDERKESELAVELGISQPAVYKRKMKILKKLKIFLEK